MVEKEWRTAMLLNNMDISRLIVYAQQFEESKIREITKEGKSLGRIILVTKSLRRVYIPKTLPWETRIGIQPKIPKVVAILLRGLGALLVGSNIWVGV